MQFYVAFSFGLLALASAHDEYLGDCPNFEPMQGFDWNEFAEGRWYAMEKFDTTSSKCFTYDFSIDPETGFKVLDQTRVIKGLKRFSIDNKYKYKGRIAETGSQAGKMEIQFPLNPLGKSSFVVMDTDYDNYAMICTCQQQSILSFVTWHRRSCTILQREPIWDEQVSEKMHKLLNDEIGNSEMPNPDHDFDKVDHSNCNYANDGKGLQIDVDKILGIAKEEVSFGIASSDRENNFADYGEYVEDDNGPDPNEDIELIV